LCGIQEKANAQTVHLVFADTKANAEKTKRAVFCQRSERKEMNEKKYITTNKLLISYGIH